MQEIKNVDVMIAHGYVYIVKASQYLVNYLAYSLPLLKGKG